MTRSVSKHSKRKIFITVSAVTFSAYDGTTINDRPHE